MNRTSKNEIHLLARIKIKFMWASGSSKINFPNNNFKRCYGTE